MPWTDWTWQLKDGALFGFVGPNGSRKDDYHQDHGTGFF